MLDPKKLEKVFVKALEHKGFSFVDVLSNCHINLGRKNQMKNAMENLEWIDSITMPKKKYDALSEEEKLNIFPTGILKQDTEAREYCDMYEDIKAAQQKAVAKHSITQDQFAKKI
jgi:2-oxoglutarate ferredoxin oxidoreductase subunit beta